MSIITNPGHTNDGPQEAPTLPRMAESQASFQRRFDWATVPTVPTTSQVPYGAKYAVLQTEPLLEKASLVQKLGLNPQVTLPLTDEDIKVVNQKMHMDQLHNFDLWLNETFPLDNVAMREWLQQVYPEYFEARAKEIDDSAVLLANMHKIKLHGPKSLEDLWLLYRISSDPELANKVMEAIGTITKDTFAGTPDQNYLGSAAMETAYQRGFFNARTVGNWNAYMPMLKSDKDTGALLPSDVFTSLLTQAAGTKAGDAPTLADIPEKTKQTWVQWVQSMANMPLAALNSNLARQVGKSVLTAGGTAAATAAIKALAGKPEAEILKALPGILSSLGYSGAKAVAGSTKYLGGLLYNVLSAAAPITPTT